MLTGLAKARQYVLSSRRNSHRRHREGGHASGAQSRNSTASSRSTNLTWKQPRHLREHLRIPGWALLRCAISVTSWRCVCVPRSRHSRSRFRAGSESRRYSVLPGSCPRTWVLKPRQEASAIGIKKIHAPRNVATARSTWATSSRTIYWRSSFRETLSRGFGRFRERGGLRQCQQVRQASHECGSWRSVHDVYRAPRK